MTSFVDLPPELHHRVCRFMNPADHCVLSQTCRLVRANVFSMPEFYKTRINLGVGVRGNQDKIYIAYNYLNSRKYGNKSDGYPLRELFAKNGEPVRHGMCWGRRIFTSAECNIALSAIVNVARLERINYSATLPPSWKHCIDVFRYICENSRNDPVFILDFSRTERGEPPRCEHLTDSFEVCMSTCLHSLLCDLAAAGVRRVNVMYWFGAGGLFAVPLHKFRYLSLEFYFGYEDNEHRDRKINIFRYFIKSYLCGYASESMFIFLFRFDYDFEETTILEQALEGIRRGLGQKETGCLLGDQLTGTSIGAMDDISPALWQTMDKDGCRISWQGTVFDGVFQLLIRGTHDRDFGPPITFGMNEQLKESVRNSTMPPAPPDV